MTENERVKLVRKDPSVNMTLEKFGEKIGVQKSAVSKIERGENNVSDQIRSAICMAFHVNEQWLRSGEGEMFAPEPVDMIGRVAREYNLSAFDENFIREFVSLPEDVRNHVYDMIMRLAAKHTPGSYPKLEDDIEAEIERYRQELLKEKDTETSSALHDTEGIA